MRNFFLTGSSSFNFFHFSIMAQFCDLDFHLGVFDLKLPQFFFHLCCQVEDLLSFRATSNKFWSVVRTSVFLYRLKFLTMRFFLASLRRSSPYRTNVLLKDDTGSFCFYSWSRYPRYTGWGFHLIRRLRHLLLRLFAYRAFPLYSLVSCHPVVLIEHSGCLRWVSINVFFSACYRSL